jgi:TolB-like protein/Tfp pilus assembly protein PilF
MKEFFRELNKRRVTRVAIAYLIIAWLVLQVADVVMPALGLPDWTITLILVLLAAGFPLAVVLSWLFDIGPGGIERTRTPAATAESPAETDTGPGTPGEASPRSIAVLPFPDLSAEQDQAYFCDGLTDELIGRLARVSGLRVASRSSSFAFRGQSTDLEAATKRLNVAHILEGGVRKDGNRVRISAQLTDVAADSILWAENYDRDLSDIFAIQQDIAGRILKALKLQLGTGELGGPQTVDPKAYEYFLRGRGYRLYHGKRDLELARSMFEKATVADPGFVEAWVSLAEVTAMQTVFMNGGEECRSASDQAGRQALELAPEDGSAHMASAFGHMAGERHEASEAAFLKALEIDPQLHTAWYYLGRTAHHAGDQAKEIEYYKKAIETNVDDWESAVLVLAPLRQAGDEHEVQRVARLAVERVEKHLEDYPDNQRAYYLGIGALITLGEMEKAEDWAENAYRLAPDDPATRYNLSCFYAQTGNVDKALDMLENSVYSRSWIEHDHDLDNLRGHPRFQRYVDSLPTES